MNEHSTSWCRKCGKEINQHSKRRHRCRKNQEKINVSTKQTILLTDRVVVLNKKHERIYTKKFSVAEPEIGLNLLNSRSRDRKA